jgi:hypothetical protein
MIGIKKDKVGFYGLDVYSLWESFDEVLKYLENKDLTKKGRLRCFNCFEPYKEGRTGVRPCDERFRCPAKMKVNLTDKIRGIFQRVIAIRERV